MLTPSFELTQDEAFLTIVIKARYAKVSEAEIYVDGTDFKFYSKPYFLRLTLPGRVTEDGRETAKYDVDKGYFTVTIPKETPGEDFEGLDMLTTLLAPAGKASAEEPLLEVIGSEPLTTEGCDKEEEEEMGEDEEDIDWQVSQQPFEEDEMTMGGSTYYGFANRRTGVFERLQEELLDIVDIPDPDHTTLLARREARQQVEQHKFDEDHYIADFLEDDCIQSVLEYKTPWDEQYQRLKKKERDEREKELSETDSIVILTEEERDQMIKLPKKQYLLDQKTDASVLLGLVDIMFAYSYDVRTTEGEHSVESAWTICKLSSTLSWLEWFTSLDDVVRACFTRALSYPLYRHWRLNLAVLKDVTMAFHLGRKQLLKCLLDIYRILSQDEPHYILNDLYITDYCIWIQSVSKEKIRSLAQALEKVDLDKSHMNFDLLEIEQAALILKEDGPQENHKSDDDSSSEDSSDDEVDSDDESADEGDDESEEITKKLQDVGRVRSKTRHSGSHQLPSRLIYQYGYPNVLSSGQQKCDSASNDEEVIVGGEAGYRQKPLNRQSGVGNDSTSEDLLQTRTMSPRQTRYEGDTAKCEDDRLENTHSAVTHIDDISAAVHKIVLVDPEEEVAFTPPSGGNLSTELAGLPMDKESVSFTDDHDISEATVVGGVDATGHLRHDGKPEVDVPEEKSTSVLLSGGIVCTKLAGAPIDKESVSFTDDHDVSEDTVVGGRGVDVKRNVVRDGKSVSDNLGEELDSCPVQCDAVSTTPTGPQSDKIPASVADQDLSEATLLKTAEGKGDNIVHLHHICSDISGQKVHDNEHSPSQVMPVLKSPENVVHDGKKEHLIGDHESFALWVKTPPNQKIEMFEEM